MATIVYQGIQSCHEPTQLIEPRTTLRLKLSSPILKPQITISQSIELFSLQDSNYTIKDYNSSSSSGGCWSSLLSLSNSTRKPLMEQTETFPYVHPLSKPKIMSESSLELCTESLGSETGSHDIIESNNIFLSETSQTRKQYEQSCLESNKVRSSRYNSHSNFPPPLKSMSGSETLILKPHREEGRLIMKAVKIPPRSNCFHAERSHGCLKLSLVEDSNFGTLCDGNIEENDTYFEQENDGTEFDERGLQENIDGVDCSSSHYNGCDCCCGGENGMEEIGKLGLMNCKAFLVAT